MRERRIPCDVLTLDGRAAWDVQTRFDFRVGPAALPRPAGDAGEDQGALAQGVRLGIPVRVGPLAAVPGARRQALPAQDRDGDPYVFGWDTSPETSPFGDVLTPLPESGIVDFTNPAAYAWWRDAHEPLFEAGVDVIKSDFGEHVPDDAVAFNGDRGRRLHNVYPLLYNHCVFEATRKFGAQDTPPMVWGRAGWAGSQRYPIQWGGDPQSDWEGLAASIRGGLSWGMSGVPYHATRHRRLLRLGAAVAGALPALAADERVQLAHARARHRRARAVGVRRGSRSDRAQMDRIPLPLASVSAAA